MSRRTASRALIAVALSVSLAACGSDDDAASPDAGSSSAAAGEVSADLTQKPEVPASDEPVPDELVMDDVVVGDGAEAVEGSTADVKYVGAFYESGEEFDSSWSNSPDYTIPVPLGAGRVIPGFEQGIEGMKVGGRRTITIPSDLGYGPDGYPPVIPGNATLVFVMDLVEVTP
ncbi:FKBP-type peptidyl-prolyl cis-trans isomerase [Blastococcus sp. TF02-09]|uniref:FKBP-type peptidyl-prolyl cis-trans isomerase n=1 Tax=Blastococcus sp. TF02-09 TaxID=2250576 RepID=UPI000DEA7DB4|nr:FKBP-type peptidyl-prolyl cis-trans isomerase [Blastococcus sp. TF02-9]RBY75674.1 FKBP-type peptidyl-prolyl cis-trans isomerase [Blastococcus sp. TF02-9]